MACFCWSFKVNQFFIVDKGLNLLLGNCSISDVCFISHQNQHCWGVGVALDFIDPVIFDIVERIAVVEVEDEENSVWICIILEGTFIVGVDNGAETLLSCSIPDLHFNNFLVDVDGLESEIHSDCYHVILVKIVISEPQQKWTFSYCWVSHHHKFEQMVILLALHGIEIIIQIAQIIRNTNNRLLNRLARKFKRYERKWKISEYLGFKDWIYRSQIGIFWLLKEILIRLGW